MEDIKIDTDVPVPGKRKVKIEYPWSAVMPGNSFFMPVPAEIETDRTLVRRWKQFLYKKAIRHWGSGNYYARSVTEGGLQGVRIWRKPNEPQA